MLMTSTSRKNCPIKPQINYKIKAHTVVSRARASVLSSIMAKVFIDQLIVKLERNYIFFFFLAFARHNIMHLMTGEEIFFKNNSR